MLLATSQGVPSRITCWSLPQRFVDGWVLARDFLACEHLGAAVTETIEAARASVARAWLYIAVRKLEKRDKRTATDKNNERRN